jgi:hypothetical protein
MADEWLVQISDPDSPDDLILQATDYAGDVLEIGFDDSRSLCFRTYEKGVKSEEAQWIIFEPERTKVLLKALATFAREQLDET